MAAADPNAKFLDSPHLSEEEPSAAWSLDDLGAAAAAESALLEAEERSVTARYWRLGRLLVLARKPFTHGQWGAFLQKWQIDKSRAAKATRIYQAFPTIAETAGLTVAEAYRRGAKQVRRRGKKVKAQQSAEPESPPPLVTIQSWSQFAETMTVVIERQLEEPEFLTPEEASAALVSLRHVMAALQQCEARLRLRCVVERTASSQE